MIIVRLTGPTSEISDLAKQLKSTAQNSGKIVRHFINQTLDDNEIKRPCDLAIIEAPEANKQ